MFTMSKVTKNIDFVLMNEITQQTSMKMAIVRRDGRL